MSKFIRLVALTLSLLFLSSAALAQSGRVRSKENSGGGLNGTKNSEETPNRVNPDGTPATKPTAIPKNTFINLHLDQSLSSKTNTKGEEFVVRVSNAVTVDGFVMLSRDTKVKCHIISVQPAGRKRRNGYITIGFDKIILEDGRELPLHASLYSVIERTEGVVDEDGEGTIKDPTKQKSTAATVAIPAATGGAIGAIGGGAAGAGIGAGVGAGVALGGVLLSKGRDIELLAGSKLQIKLDGDLKVEPTDH